MEMQKLLKQFKYWIVKRVRKNVSLQFVYISYLLDGVSDYWTLVCRKIPPLSPLNQNLTRLLTKEHICDELTLKDKSDIITDWLRRQLNLFE